MFPARRTCKFTECVTRAWRLKWLRTGLVYMLISGWLQYRKAKVHCLCLWRFRFLVYIDACMLLSSHTIHLHQPDITFTSLEIKPSLLRSVNTPVATIQWTTRAISLCDFSHNFVFLFRYIFSKVIHQEFWETKIIVRITRIFHGNRLIFCALFVNRKKIIILLGISSRFWNGLRMCTEVPLHWQE